MNEREKVFTIGCAQDVLWLKKHLGRDLMQLTVVRENFRADAGRLADIEKTLNKHWNDCGCGAGGAFILAYLPLLALVTAYSDRLDVFSLKFPLLAFTGLVFSAAAGKIAGIYYSRFRCLKALNKLLGTACRERASPGPPGDVALPLGLEK